ncbi:hypothetical protein T190115A13A_270053 [Tenacibaculum sp. 190524A02b]|uniref:Uncharacterized protein n=1 Tax=Tenacibaculum vairaonense TaxID=3137860 RepID=A0ABP1FA90_9FLAO
MKLSIFNKAFNLAVSKGFNYDYEEIELFELEEIYEEALEFLKDSLDPILLDAGEIYGSNDHVSYNLPYGQGDSTGQFAFDKETETYSHEAQDLDGKLYLIVWKA